MTVQSACFRMFEHCKKQGQPLSVRDLAYLTQISEEGCRVAMKVFREQGWIQRVETPFGLRGTYYELVDGAVYPGDQRGVSEKARAQQALARERSKEARRLMPRRTGDETPWVDSVCGSGLVTA